jgi:hypothetical protein
MNFWSSSAFFTRCCAALWVLCALAACGGGGGGGDVIGGDVIGSSGGGNDPVVSGGNPPASAHTSLQAGVFASSVAIAPSYPETVAILMPSPPANPRWWALRRDSASRVSIFSGNLAQDGQGTGRVDALQAYVADQARTGSAALTGVSANGFSARVSLAANPSAQPPLSAATVDLAAVKSAASLYDSATAADLALLEGNWTGVWIDGLRSSAAATVSIRGGVVTLPGAVLGCLLDANSRVATVAGVNLYRVALSFPSAQFNCERSAADATQPARVLEGVAWIHVLPDARLRLEFVAVDAAGSGVVFRATR